MKKDSPTKVMDRRDFLQATAATGAGLFYSQFLSAESLPNKDDLNIAMIGVGRQGKILLDLVLKIPGIRIKAVCDIWSYSQKRAVGMCRRAKQNDVKIYEDYNDMLSTEKDLDAVIIATPDFVHHEHTNACLAAGLHVYCEKEMSNDIEKARSMVKAAEKSGKLLQIGHQRRSNPYYKHTYGLMHNDKFFGNIHSVNGQWHQQKPLQPTPPKIISKYALSADAMKKYGYGSMDEFYNWRWFNKLAGGPMTDLGSHQVDIFNWYLKAPPSSVYASGGNEYAQNMAKTNEVGYTPESLDHTMAMYEWDTPHGKVRGIYQVNLLSSHGLFYEVFMGDKGSMTISEIKSKNAMLKEKTADALEWEDEAEIFEVGGEKAMKFDPLKSRKAKGKMDKEGLKLEEDMNKPAHQPHLENFFAAIRDGVALTCPAEIGFETCVAVIKANESARTGKRIEFSPSDFKA